MQANEILRLNRNEQPPRPWKEGGLGSARLGTKATPTVSMILKRRIMKKKKIIKEEDRAEIERKEFFLCFFFWNPAASLGKLIRPTIIPAVRRVFNIYDG